MRGFLITTIVLLAIGAGAAWHFDLFAGAKQPDSQPGEQVSVEAIRERELGPELYTAVALEPAPSTANGHSRDPIVIDAHLVVIDKQEVPSKRAGQVLFIGELLPDDAPLGPEVYTAKVIIGGKEVVKRYRRLEEGARVHEDQMVAMLDYSIALNDKLSKGAKVDAAQYDLIASAHTKDEAKARLDRQDRLRQDSPRYVTPEDYSAAVLTWNRYKYEELGKKAAVTQAELDRDQADIVLKEHEIRDKIPGQNSRIKVIYKNRGDAVKEGDSILQLYNLDRLRAEGLLEVQYLAQLLRKDIKLKVSLEPSEEDAPLRVLNEHRGEVTGVAVSGDPQNPLIVSGSLDSTVRVWKRTEPRALRVLYHPAPVKAVACSPPGSRRHLLLTGCGNGGLVRLYDLDKLAGDPLVWDSASSEQPSPHSAVTALAFSPDGTWFATGGEENTIALWQTEGCKLLYTFDAEHGVDNPHQGTITALHFTPQGTLVSASRDRTVRVWRLRQKGAHLINDPSHGLGGKAADKEATPPTITGLAGNVGDLGTSADGKWTLVDKGSVLQVVSLADLRPFSTLHTSAGATQFDTLALFSPDARLILTAGAPEGRLQLWRAPTDGQRGFEVRQFTATERSPVTCAAFAPDAGIAPDGSFAVSGNKDGYVYVWAVPDQAKVQGHRIEGLKLTLIERSLDASTRQLRVGVTVQNTFNNEYPDGRLTPGRPVSIVIEPE